MLTAREAQLLAIPAVVDLVCEFPEPRVLRESPGYRLLPVLDGTSPTLQQLREGSQYIEESLARGGVYIHCAVGHGRGATMVAAHLLLAGHARTVEQAVAMIRQKRKRIVILPCQAKSLRALLEE